VNRPEQERWLRQEWVHAHEEDTAEARVFRPASFSFPPSRGRRTLDLRRAATLRQTRPGADDRPEAQSGRWRIEGDTLILEGDETKPAERLEIVSLSADRLALRRS
jgi:hypothetical protein